MTVKAPATASALPNRRSLRTLSVNAAVEVNAATREALRFLARVFWFTCEFGVIEEDGELRCYGAGLLSSFGEIDEFRAADIRPIDFHVMATLEYDITRYQPILFACDGMGELTDRVGGFFANFDDDTPARLARDAGAAAVTS